MTHFFNSISENSDFRGWEATLSRDRPDNNVKAARFLILSSFFQIQGQTILIGIQGYRAELPFHQIHFRDSDRGENRGLVLTDLWARGLLRDQTLGYPGGPVL